MNKFSWSAFEEMPIVGIVRNLPAGDMLRIATAYADAGMTTIEITLNTPGALESITALNAELVIVEYRGTGTFVQWLIYPARNAGAALS